jgi:hypothetical protein
MSKAIIGADGKPGTNNAGNSSNSRRGGHHLNLSMVN